MKLKKIASLMLAGIMAVSMLTACDTASNGNTNGNDDVIVTPAPTSIVTAVNNGQSATNKVKIDFTADASLDAALAKAVKAVGEGFTNGELDVQLSRLTGINFVGKGYLFGGAGEKGNMYATVNAADPKYDNSAEKTGKYDGTVVERIFAVPQLNIMADKAAAEKAAAHHIDSVVAMLDDTTLDDNTQNGQKYYDFDYTGSVSMVSSTAIDGTVNYYYAFVITQTATLKTLEPVD